MTTIKVISLLAAILFTGGVTMLASAQNPAPQGKSLAASAGVFAYPSKGQDAGQQAKDEAECYNWARDQSGYDPMSPPKLAAAPVQPTEPAPGGERAKGLIRGAAAGAVIGEVANNDAGGGAAIGATVGLLAGGRKSRMAQSQQKQQAQAQQQASEAQVQAEYAELAATFKRGMSVCLEARGYAVK
jgi:outer membrane protein with glycine zipper